MPQAGAGAGAFTELVREHDRVRALQLPHLLRVRFLVARLARTELLIHLQTK